MAEVTISRKAAQQLGILPADKEADKYVVPMPPQMRALLGTGKSPIVAAPTQPQRLIPVQTPEQKMQSFVAATTDPLGMGTPQTAKPTGQNGLLERLNSIKPPATTGTDAFVPQATLTDPVTPYIPDVAPTEQPPVEYHDQRLNTTFAFSPDTTVADMQRVIDDANAESQRRQALGLVGGVSSLIQDAASQKQQYPTISNAAAAAMSPQAMQSFTDMQNRRIAEQQAIDMEIRRIQAQQSMDQRRMDNLNINKRLDQVLTVNDAKQRAELAREQARINAQRQLEELEYRKKYLEEQSRHNSAMEGAAQSRADAYASKASDQNFNEDYDIGNGLMYFAQGDMERVTRDGVPVYIGKRGSYFERQAKMEEQKYQNALDWEKELIRAGEDPKRAKVMSEERFGINLGGSAQSGIPSGLVKMVDKETGEIVFVDQASQQVYTAEELKGMNK